MWVGTYWSHYLSLRSQGCTLSLLSKHSPAKEAHLLIALSLVWLVVVVGVVVEQEDHKGRRKEAKDRVGKVRWLKDSLEQLQEALRRQLLQNQLQIPIKIGNFILQTTILLELLGRSLMEKLRIFLITTNVVFRNELWKLFINITWC